MENDDIDGSFLPVQNLISFVEGEYGYDENIRDILGKDHIDGIMRGMDAMYFKEQNFKQLLKQKDGEIAKLKKNVPGNAGNANEINKEHSSSGTWDISDITTINKDQE